MRILATAALALLMAVPASQAQFATSKGQTVYINLDKTFNEYYKTKLADQQLKEQAEEFNNERKDLVTAYEEMQKQFNKSREESTNSALSEDARNKLRQGAEEKLNEMRDQEQKIRQFDTRRRKQLEEQGRRMRARIVKEIREEISKYARNQGFAAVHDSSGQSLNGVDVILYHDESNVDITNVMIEILNKNAKTSLAPGEFDAPAEEPAAGTTPEAAPSGPAATPVPAPSLGPKPAKATP